MSDPTPTILAELRAWLRERRELELDVLRSMGFPVDRIGIETLPGPEGAVLRTETEQPAPAGRVEEMG